MANRPTPDWSRIRTRASAFPKVAFDFVREGLAQTAARVHGNENDTAVAVRTDSRHVGGRELCMGLRELAIKRYGLLAATVLGRWGIAATDDFGVIVYTMIDRKELKPSDDDHFEDFCGVYEFDEAFAAEHACELR